MVAEGVVCFSELHAAATVRSMPTTIPLGFHVFSMSFSVAGSTHTCTTTCGGKNGGYLTAASINTVWRNALISASRPFTSAQVPSGWTQIESKVLANIGGVLQSDVNTTVSAGTGLSTPPPMNTCLLVKKVTGFAGRPYQARWMAPPNILESAVNAAGVITAGLSTLQTQWDAAYADLQTNLLDPVILHDPTTGLIPTKIASFVVQQRIGTIGRRFRR